MLQEKGKKKYQPNNYVNNKTFLEYLVTYKTSPNQKLFNELGKIFLRIAQRYITKPKFMGYSKDRQDEMVSDACMFMITSGIRDFDPAISTNAFSYFTQVSHNSFLQHINKTKLRESRCSNLNYIDKLEESEISNYDD